VGGRAPHKAEIMQYLNTQAANTIPESSLKTLELLVECFLGVTPPSALSGALDSDWEKPSYAFLSIDSALRNLGPLSDFAIVSFEYGNTSLRCVGRNSRPMQLHVRFNTDAPHLLQYFWMGFELENGVEIRKAKESDAALLDEMDRYSPIQRDDGSSSYINKHGKHLLYSAIAGCDELGIAFRDGKPATVQARSLVPVRYRGIEQFAEYCHQTRTNPKLGSVAQVFSILHSLGSGYIKKASFLFTVADALNKKGLRLSGDPHWDLYLERLLIPCHSNLSSEGVREATPDDIEIVIKILNHAHADKELFRPYTPANLMDRLGRKPEEYTWSNLLMKGKAVLGVWPVGEERKIVKGDVENTTVRGLVYDFGYLEGCEQDMLDLLRVHGNRCRVKGMTHLALLSTAKNREYALLKSLSSCSEPYALNTIVPMTPRAENHGFYLDHACF